MATGRTLDHNLGSTMVTPTPYSCAKCGYTLTGLRKVGSCPECGAVYSLLSGRGVQVRPHEMHIVSERAKAITSIVWYSIVSGGSFLLALAMTTYFSPKEYPLWLLVLFIVMALYGAVRVVECRRDLKKLDGL